MNQYLATVPLALLGALLLLSCDQDEPSTQPDAATSSSHDSGTDLTAPPDLGTDMGPQVPLAAAERGPHSVGVSTLAYVDDARSRTLDVEIWYPSDSIGEGAVLDFEVEPNRGVLSGLFDAAPDCASRTTTAARDAAAKAGSWPLIVFSHCHACTRYSSLSIAEHLASWGYVVVAPDHEDNTLFDELNGTGESVGEDFLAVRAADIGFVLDQVLAEGVPDGVEIDAGRIGMMGHSFGSVTTGLVAQNDDRIGAALGFAAPMESPLLPGVTVADINVPLMFMVAVEDNSIREIGNRLIRDNFAKAQGEAWKVEVAEAGHWSFSDLAGLIEMFDAGCGEGTRQVGGDVFTFIDPALGRTIAGAYALAFFEATLNDDPAARLFLEQAPPWADVTLESATE